MDVLGGAARRGRGAHRGKTRRCAGGLGGEPRGTGESARDGTHRGEPVTDLLGLGIDAGGTRTRWALATAPGEIVGEGEVRGMSALQVREERHVRETLAELAAGVLAHGRPARVHAGLTGFGENIEALRGLVAAPLSLARAAVTVGSDIEIAYLDAFVPGGGYVVYARTGSVAAFLDAHRALHRAGGRGAILDDGGGGFWIGPAALRHVWPLEDAQPRGWA